MLPARPLLSRRTHWRNRRRVRRRTSGRSVYNYFRDYDAVTGRYIQSDPIGVAGGLNAYAYASANPVGRIDPSGLVDWTGTIRGLSVTRGPGAGSFSIELISQCVDGRRARVDILAVGPGLGFGADVSFEMSGIEVKDRNRDLRPAELNGLFALSSASATPGIGIGLYVIAIGVDSGMAPTNGATGRGFGLTYGLGAGVNNYIGSSTVLDFEYENCDTCGQ